MLSKQRVIHVSSFKPIPLDRTVVSSLDEMAANDNDNDEPDDPLDDVPDSTPIDSQEPSIMDLAEHQNFDDAYLDEGLVPLQPLPPVRGRLSNPRQTLLPSPLPTRGS